MNKTNGFFNFLIFLISPLISLLIALRNPKQDFSYNTIWFFTVFFGLTFAITNDSTSDVVRYLEEFNSWKVEGKNLSYLFINSYVKDGYEDVFFPLISLVAAKLNFSNVLFLGFLGLIFGYFYSRVYKLLILEINYKKDFLLFLLLATFLLINPIWRGINGFRFGLASIILVYIILKSFRDKYHIYDIILISSLFLIHFSMFLPTAIFLVYYFFGKKLNINFLFYLYIFSFFFNAINLDSLNEILKNYVPEFLNNKVDSYARESYVDEISETTANTNWYAVFFLKVLFYACSIMLVYIYTRFKDLINSNLRFDFLIKFTFVFSIIVNLTGFIPSLSRMGLISTSLTLYLFILLICNFKINRIHMLRLKFLIIPLLLLYTIVQMRIGFDFISTETIYGNPIGAFFDFKKSPLIDLIK